ncbi:MAG: hypothetical protein P8019_14225 [Gammaproteobacteria bacterium]|jgi:hypothetical protein
MDSSPITAWANSSAYFTFANHESVIVAVLLISIAMTIYVIGGIMRHEKKAEEELSGIVESAESADFGEVAEEIN